MADIFISYASEDRDTAQQLARALGDRGWSVWWDRTLLAGKDYGDVIEAELVACGAVIVLWSEHAIASKWVKAEAREGLEDDRLIPVMLGETKVPFLFKSLQAERLDGWSGDTADPRYQQLAEAVIDKIGSPKSGTAETVPKPEIAREPKVAPSPGISWISRVKASIGEYKIAVFVSVLLVFVVGLYWESTRTRETTIVIDPSAVWSQPGTNLRWTVGDNGENVDWTEANTYCESLELNSLSDWRLPTIEEAVAFSRRILQSADGVIPILLNTPHITVSQQFTAVQFNPTTIMSLGVNDRTLRAICVTDAA